MLSGDMNAKCNVVGVINYSRFDCSFSDMLSTFYVRLNSVVTW